MRTYLHEISRNSVFSDFLHLWYSYHSLIYLVPPSASYAFIFVILFFFFFCSFFLSVCFYLVLCFIFQLKKKKRDFLKLSSWILICGLIIWKLKLYENYLYMQNEKMFYNTRNVRLSICIYKLCLLPPQRARRRNIASYEIAGNDSQIFVVFCLLRRTIPYGYSGKQLYRLLAISTREENIKSYHIYSVTQ